RAPRMGRAVRRSARYKVVSAAGGLLQGRAVSGSSVFPSPFRGAFEKRLEALAGAVGGGVELLAAEPEALADPLLGLARQIEAAEDLAVAGRFELAEELSREAG